MQQKQTSLEVYLAAARILQIHVVGHTAENLTTDYFYPTFFPQ